MTDVPRPLRDPRDDTFPAKRVGAGAAAVAGPELSSDVPKAVRGVLRLLARPVRTARGGRGVVLQPYRGYGSTERIFLIGRAFRQRTEGGEDDVRAIIRRIRRRPVRGARIRARFYGAETVVATDRDGYFRVEMAPGAPVPRDRVWHCLELAMLAPERIETAAEVYIPPDRARLVVVSDIDDTVMHTGVANKAAMLWRLFVQDAESRTVFPGVSRLYRALHAGVSGDEGNPMLYVSRAPWGIYHVLEAFFQRHGIPVGPILFLREWGISWRRPVPRRARDHKRRLIEAMMALYDRMPFVLIGDSGQRDPEVYRRIVERHGGRVLAVYIRDVAARGPERAAEVAAMAEALRAVGAHLVLAGDSLAIAKDAARLGLIATEAVESVRERVEERRLAEAEPAAAEP
jgi:phosphatidate phosphatase APP1